MKSLLRQAEVIEEAEVIENDFIKSWKDQGKKVVGYSCIATPKEFIEAAGMLPYRIRALGNPNTEIADAHLSRYNCRFCRSCLQLGLDGTYEFLDGLVETNGCDHLRGMFENWQHEKDYDFFHYLKVPHIINQDSLDYFRGELIRFKNALEEHFEVQITDENLTDAINTENLVREKLRELYRLREREKPSVWGSEAMSVTLLESAMPREDFLRFVSRILDERKDQEISDYRARLMLCGSATDELDFIRDIENMGGLVVTDALCYGTHAFWKLEPGEGDVMSELAKAYLEHLLCPRMFDDYQKRIDFVLEAVKRANVEGVILVHNKICDIHGVDNVKLRMDLEKEGVPALQLEKDYGAPADMGRIRTRVQAFLEKIGA